MKTEILSREKMVERLKGGKLENTAVISFYDTISQYSDPDYSPVDFKGKCDDVFLCEFDDIGDDEIDVTNVSDFFADCDKLAEFVYKAYKNGMDIISQCEYGEGRSAGCCAAIREHFFGDGIEIFSDYRYYPNKLVFHAVYDALERYKANS